VRQGITTEITGNCGSSAAPLAGADLERRRRDWREQDGIEADWSDVASYFDRLERTGMAANQALLLGQGTLRANAIGNQNRRLTAEELAGLLADLEAGLDQGAFGLSTGLEYTPGRFTPTDEILAMARVVARRGGLYASHVRNEEATLLEAVHEAIEIGRSANVRVEISHLKAAGRSFWDKQAASLALIEAGRSGGVEVAADAYPYTAYSTGLTILLEPWAREGMADDLVGRLRDPEQRARIRREVDAHVQNEPGGYELIVISGVASAANREIVGLDLATIAAGWHSEPAEAVLRLLEQEQGAVSFIGHGMSEDNVSMVLRHPLVMVGSDGSSMAPTGKAAEGRPHPRNYGTYARILGHYVRERRLLDLPAAIRKMTSMPADQVGLRNRGRIGKGLKADLVVFDAATVAERASFAAPHAFAEGFALVLVNGVAVVERDRQTGARPGRVLRKG
jgi:N-acyl-D-amino-acid deacylase